MRSKIYTVPPAPNRCRYQEGGLQCKGELYRGVYCQNHAVALVDNYRLTTEEYDSLRGGTQMPQTYIEKIFMQLICDEKLPEPLVEVKLVPERQFRADFVWFLDLPIWAAALEIRGLAVEIDGGVYTQGRHTRGSGFTRDLEKMNETLLNGFLVLRFTPEQVESGKAMGWLKEMMRKLDIIKPNERPVYAD